MDSSGKVFLFQEGNLVVPEKTDDAEIISGLPEVLVRKDFGNIALERIPGLDGNNPVPSFLLDASAELPRGWKGVPLRSSLHNMENRDLRFFSLTVQSILRTYHLLQWKKNTVFCGRCASLNRDSGYDISRVCSSCGNIIFPKISPAVIVLINDGQNRILLAQNKRFRNQVYSLVAGFVEAGESLEETVVREVKEETGIDVDSIQYITSQPWPFPDSMMLGFRAKYAGGELKPDGDEIIDVRWFSRDNMPNIPGPGAIARLLIDRWMQETCGASPEMPGF